MPIKFFESKKLEVETKYKEWLSKQPKEMEVFMAGFTGAVQGAGLGAFVSLVTNNPAMAPPGGSAAMMPGMGGSPVVLARNFGVMTGVNSAITKYLVQTRGVEDINTTMLASFGGGAAFALVSKMGLPAGASMPGIGGLPPVPVVTTPMSLATDAVVTGGVFSLMNGLFFKVGGFFGGGPPQPADPAYARTRTMLTTLGLSQYEKNFQKCLLNDQTLPLLNDSALSEARVPPGPRLLILDATTKKQY